MKKIFLKNKGFSLVELLVVIALIGMVTTIATLSITTIRAKSRDTKRLEDIKQIQNALQSYFIDEKEYPASLTPGQALIGPTSSTTYIKIIPTAPNQADGNCTNELNQYVYQQTENGKSYKLSFCLGGRVSELTEADKCATPKGIANENCFTCGDQVIYSGQTYNTVLIGGQCWFKENLNIGTRINTCLSGACSGNCGSTCATRGTTASNSTDNSAIEKYCYNDTESNCTTYGALYQWNEAIQYSGTEGVQGICPAGWHVPTDNDFKILIEGQATPGCESGDYSQCSPAGSHLSDYTSGHDNSSGFSALLAGLRYTDGSFAGKDASNFLWSSSEAWFGDAAYYRWLYSGYDTVYRWYAVLGDAYTVRCLKN